MKNVKLNQEFNLNYPLFKRIFSFPPFKKNEDNKRSLSKRSTDSIIENNDQNLIKVNLVLAISILFGTIVTTSLAQAQIEKTIQYEPKLMEDGTYEFNIAEACKGVAAVPGTKICNITSKTGMKIKVTFGSNSAKPDWFDSMYDNRYGNIFDGARYKIIAPTLESTHPIKSAFGNHCSSIKKERNKDSYFVTLNDSDNRYFYGCRFAYYSGIDVGGARFITIKDRDNSPIVVYSIDKIYVSPYMTSITPILIKDANTLLAYYRSNLDTVYRLQGTIGKTFRPMAARLYSAILGIVKMMSSENEENPLSGINSNISKLPITHDSIREQSRLIMVLAEVIVAMIKDEYGDTTVPEIKNYIDSLLPLSSELRLAFGWETGVAGKGSKVIASISTVIEESLKSLHEAVIFYNLKDNKHQGAFNELVFRNIVLKKAVLAREQGDAGAMREVIAFQTSWNSQAWQEFMTNFLKDPKNKYLTASFKTLLAAVSSLQDFKTDDNNNKLPFLGLGLSTVENK